MIPRLPQWNLGHQGHHIWFPSLHIHYHNHCVSLCVTVCHCVSLCVIVCHCVSFCVIVCHCVVVCLEMSRLAQWNPGHQGNHIWCPSLHIHYHYHCVSLCVIVCHCVSLCVIVCHSVSLCVIVCHCESLCHCVSRNV